MPKKSRNASKRQSSAGRFCSALMDPFHVHDVKIPDMVCNPSNLCYQYAAYDVTSDAAGKIASIFTPHTIVKNLADYYWYNVGTIAGATITWSTTASVASPSSTTLQSLCYQKRLVSAGMMFIPQASLTAAAGIIAVAHVPMSNASFTPLTDASLINSGNTTCAFPAVDSWSAFLKPADYSSFEYADMNSISASRGENYLVVYGSGLPASTVVGRMLLVANYEVLPYTSANGILPALPSFSSVRELEIAANTLSSAAFISAAAFMSSPGLVGQGIGAQAAATAAMNNPGRYDRVYRAAGHLMDGAGRVISSAAGSDSGRRLLTVAASQAAAAIASWMQTRHQITHRPRLTVTEL